jgi:hypothetical protein
VLIASARILDLASRRPEDAFHGEMLGECVGYHEGEVAGDVTGPIAPGLGRGDSVPVRHRSVAVVGAPGAAHCASPAGALPR